MEILPAKFVDVVVPRAKKLTTQASPHELEKSYEELDGEFKEVVDDLNYHKNFFNGKDPHKILASMRKCDLFHNLKNLATEKFNMQVATNAALKIYEILAHFHIKIFTSGVTTKVFCNAELPGAMLVTINHYCVVNKFSFEWLACSYVNSANDSLLGDQYGLYAKNRGRWIMDYSETDPAAIDGNLTNPEVIRKIQRRVRETFPDGVDLYTSDAGIDVSNDYDTQEEQTLMINYGQIISGLTVLKEGGCLITKQYTFSTAFNRSLIIVLSTLFKELHIIKPKTSRPANSEIYIVGIDFVGITPELTEYLLSKLVFDYDYKKPTVPLCINDSALDRVLLEATNEIHLTRQIECLKFSQRYFKLYESRAKRDLKKIDDAYNDAIVSEISRWIDETGIQKIITAKHL